MPKKKVRFTIQAGEQESELFSVRELGNSDLIINLKRAEQHGSDAMTEDYKDLTESRLTVHRSPSSPGFTINYHTTFSGGGSRKASTYVEPKNGNLLWPIFACETSDLSNKRYLSQAKSNDEIVRLGVYDPSLYTLMYMLVLCDKSTDVGILESNDIYHDFLEFRIAIYWVFSLSPSFHQGGVIFPSTTEYSIDGSKGEILNHNASSLEVNQLAALLGDTLDRFANIHVDRMIRWLKKGGVKIATNFERDQRAMARTFSKVPWSL